MSHIKSITGIRGVGKSDMKEGSSFNSTSSSLLYDNSSYLASADNTSNFLINLESFNEEKNVSASTRNVLKESHNIKTEEPRGKSMKSVEIIGPERWNTGESSSQKENIKDEDTAFILADLFNKNLMGPPTSILRKPGKPCVSPPMPMIMETSREDLSANSMSSSACSDYMDLNTNHLPTFISSLRNSNIPQPKANKAPINNSHILLQSEESYASVPGITTSSITPLHFEDSELVRSDTCKNTDADLWDEFDEEINKSLAINPVRFDDLNATQNGLKFDDAGFQSFTEEEAKELMDKEEAERLQFITSGVDDMSGKLLADSSTIFDNDMSMGKYFGKRSSHPFKLKANESSMFTEKSFEVVRTSFREYERPESVNNRSLTFSSKRSHVKKGNSFKAENDELTPLKPADTSLDSLGKFFMGPESEFLSGNPKGMMDYIINYCKQASQENASNSDELSIVQFLSNSKMRTTGVNKSSNISKSSSESSGVSSLDSTKTLTPKNSGIKRSLEGEFKSCKQPQQEEVDGESKSNSLILAYPGAVPKLNDATFIDSSYNKFKNDLLLSCQQANSSHLDISKQLPMHQDRFWERENNVSNPERHIGEYCAKVNQSTNTTQRSLELLRKNSSSPPERLSAAYDINKNPNASTSNLSRGAHSTPLQQSSLSQTMAKQLGIINTQSASNLLTLGNSLPGIVEDSAKGSFLAEYNFVNRDKIAEHVPNKIREQNPTEAKLMIRSTEDLSKTATKNSRAQSVQKPPASQKNLQVFSKPSVSAQTSFKHFVPADNIPPSHNSHSQMYNPSVNYQHPSMGFPLIIQIHCACSGGVNVVSNQQQSAPVIPVDYVPQQPVQSQVIGESGNALHCRHVQGNENNGQQPPYKQSLDLPQKDELNVKKHTHSNRIASIEVEKLNLGWGCVEFGKTETNTICISSKEMVECRFKATIAENSPTKNFKFVLEPSDPRIKEYERVGILPPMGKAILKVNFTPQKTGPVTGRILLKFHTIPIDGGFKSEIPLVAHGGEGLLNLVRPITATALYLLSVKETGIIDFLVENTKGIPLYAAVVVTDRSNVKLPASKVMVDPQEFLLPSKANKEVKLHFTYPFSLKKFKVYVIWIEDISRLRYIRSYNSPDRIHNKTKTSTFNNEVIQKLLDGLTFRWFKKETATAVQLTNFKPTQDDFSLLHNFRVTVMELTVPSEPDKSLLGRPSDIGYAYSSDNASSSYSTLCNNTDSFRPDLHTDLRLMFKQPQSNASKFSGEEQSNEGRAGDSIKIQNKEINFSKVSVGQTSRKIVYITNSGAFGAKFVLTRKANNGKIPTPDQIADQFTMSATEGTIDRSSTKEIIVTFRPNYLGVHSVRWKLDVTFIHNAIQMKKLTDVCLQGEGIK